MGLCERLAEVLPEIQNELFDLGSDLCFLEEDKQRYRLPQLEARHVERLEALIDEMTAVVGPLEASIPCLGARSARHSSTWRGPSAAARRTGSNHAGARRGRGSPRVALFEPALRRAVRDGAL